MKKRITAEELMAKLNADPEFVAMQAGKERERQRREEELQIAEAPLVNDLREAGFLVESAWDLVNTTDPYTSVLPILLKHLSRPYPGPIREGIARALAVPEAIFGWNVLVNNYRNEKESRAKDGLAVAIAGAADDEVIGDVIALARDTRHGESRLLLLSALERSADPRAMAVLVELATDPDLTKEIEVILRRKKRKLARASGARLAEEADETAIRKYIERGETIDTSELAEASTNFDIEDVNKFFSDMAGLIGWGFSVFDANNLTYFTRDMDHNATGRFGFDVLFHADRYPLYIEVFMDDIDAPDIACFTGEPLAEEIVKLMEEIGRIAEERGEAERG